MAPRKRIRTPGGAPGPTRDEPPKKRLRTEAPAGADDPTDAPADAKADTERKADGPKRFWVYVLESVTHPNFSYIGYTVDRQKRIRQHNGELASNHAKYTSRHRPWRMVMSISSDQAWFTKTTALQLEWRAKHVCKGRSRRRPTSAAPGRRWKTLHVPGNHPAFERRLNDICWLLHNRKKWSKNALEWKEDQQLQLEIDPKLVTPQLSAFVAGCDYWKPKLVPFDHQTLIK